jgi:hypothetical protein
MNVDDILWAMIGAGALLSIAYVRAEFRAHRTYRELDHERFEREQRLWPSRRPSTGIVGHSPGNGANSYPS